MNESLLNRRLEKYEVHSDAGGGCYVRSIYIVAFNDCFDFLHKRN